MKLLLDLTCLLILLSISALCETDESFCNSEVPKAIAETCHITASIAELADALLNYDDQLITHGEFKQFYDNYCFRMANQTDCILESGADLITDQCKNSLEFESTVLNMRYNKLFADYYCGNGGKRQMDAIKLDGVACLFSDIHINCLQDALGEKEIRTNSEMCEFINETISCEHQLDGCANQYVKQYRAELFRILLSEFRCM